MCKWSPVLGMESTGWKSSELLGRLQTNRSKTPWGQRFVYQRRLCQTSFLIGLSEVYICGELPKGWTTYLGKEGQSIGCGVSVGSQRSLIQHRRKLLSRPAMEMALFLRASLLQSLAMLSVREQFILRARTVILGAYRDDRVILLARLLFYIENIKYSASNHIIHVSLSLFNLIMSYCHALS